MRMKFNVDKLEIDYRETETALSELIPQYAANKAELDDYKKICDRENKQIKELMLAAGKKEYESGGYVAKYSVQQRESMNEDMLLQIAHYYGLSEIVKTKEYIDFDALENAIYKGLIKEDILTKMNDAKEVKEVVTLRVSKVKKKKED